MSFARINVKGCTYQLLYSTCIAETILAFHCIQKYSRESIF